MRALRDGSLAIERIEIFYDLQRLKEVFSNMLRYEGQPYRVRTACAGVKEIVPGMGGYLFDDSEFLIGAYWAQVPPHDRPRPAALPASRSGPISPILGRDLERGTALNPDGTVDMPAVRDVALQLGLEADAGRISSMKRARSKSATGCRR